jgi:hypothetical protein
MNPTEIILAMDAASFELDEATLAVNGQKCNDPFVGNGQFVDPTDPNFIAMCNPVYQGR